MSTTNSLHYLTDAADKPEAVLLPMADWLELKQYYRQLQGREFVLDGTLGALREVPEMLAGRQPEISLDGFLASL
ncbi:hypothetical protein [Hymenobacter coccineus]|uniref:Prevent-host-death protein n=1 Tax=Hymenobacter coccineus TaxID=1908235 RepID=A0A1G1STB1_9BACT|nr:hypothetical protein [Hymenobacter coccineus]OGX81852.1 hypothetical protein BEN49_14890 [Hymenobacter coccineus]